MRLEELLLRALLHFIVVLEFLLVNSLLIDVIEGIQWLQGTHVPRVRRADLAHLVDLICLLLIYLPAGVVQTECVRRAHRIAEADTLADALKLVLLGTYPAIWILLHLLDLLWVVILRQRLVGTLSRGVGILLLVLLYYKVLYCAFVYLYRVWWVEAELWVPGCQLLGL